MIRRFLPDRSGATAAEFALVVPVYILIVLGLIQAGMFFWANAGLKNGVGEGARLASLYPRKDDAAIVARIRGSAFGIAAADLTTPILTHGKSGKVDYVDISVSYRGKLVLFNVPAITMTETQRVYRP